MEERLYKLISVNIYSKIEADIPLDTPQYIHLKNWVKAHLPSPVKESVQWVFRHSRALLKKDPSKLNFPFTDTINLGDKKAAFTVANIHEWLHCLNSNYEKEVRDLFLTSIKSRTNPRVAIIGAAQGGHAIAAALHGAKVYAFEPDPNAFKKLLANLGLNQEQIKDFVLPFPFIVSDTDGIETIFYNPNDSFAASTANLDKFTEKKEIQAFKIDTLLEKGEIEPFEILLIDAEGSEKKVLEGMSEFLSSDSRPAEIFLELHPDYLEKFGTNPSEVCSILSRFGYRLKWKKWRKTEIHTFFTSY